MLDHVSADLSRRHPGIQFEVVDAGVNGNTIADIQARLGDDVIALKPSAVVLYWDSDVSDVDESRLPPPEAAIRRAAYQRALHDVVKRLIDTGAHVVMSGPTLIGEAPRGRNPKDRMLDDYRRINRAVARSFNLAYVDTRRAFLTQLAQTTPTTQHAGADPGRTRLTEDGEHLNEAGAEVARRLFVAALDGWLRARPAPAARAPGDASGPSLRPTP